MREADKKSVTAIVNPYIECGGFSFHMASDYVTYYGDDKHISKHNADKLTDELMSEFYNIFCYKDVNSRGFPVLKIGKMCTNRMITYFEVEIR